MSKPSAPITMTPTRFQQLLDAYGAQPHRWPEAERAMAMHFLANRPATVKQQRHAAQLDALLDLVQASEPSRGLRQSVLPAMGLGRRTFQETFSLFWRPMGALACSALLGLMLGAQSVWPVMDTQESIVGLEDEMIVLAYGVDWDGEGER